MNDELRCPMPWTAKPDRPGAPGTSWRVEGPRRPYAMIPSMVARNLTELDARVIAAAHELRAALALLRNLDTDCWCEAKEHTAKCVVARNAWNKIYD